MDDAIDDEVSRPHVVRTLLLLLGAVAGLLVLGTVFGASSASADDGHDEQGSSSSLLGGVVSAVTETVAAPVHQTSAVVSHVIAQTSRPVATAIAETPVAGAAPDAASVTTPVSRVADTIVQNLVGGTALGEFIGPRPVAAVLGPVADLVDGSVTAAQDAGPSLTAPSALTTRTASADSPAIVALARPAVSGAAIADVSALGSRGDRVPPPPVDEVVSGAPSTAAVAAALAMLAAPVLLVLRRRSLLDRAVPGSPVSETDSSPD
jgi:hypothetical protein